MDINKMMIYARLIEINTEIIDLVIEFSIVTKRWKYKKLKTFKGHRSRLGKIMEFTHQIRNLVMEKKILQLKLKPGLSLCGGGVSINVNEEVILPKKNKKLKSSIDRRTYTNK